MSNSKAANNRFAQSIFDCRDILLPKGSGKGGQRRRSDLRNILFTIATQGEYAETESNFRNGLWWTQACLEANAGIGRDQLRAHIDWLDSVGLVPKKKRMNATTILWVNQEKLREITQRQLDDRQSYRALKESELNSGLISEHENIPEFDPEDLELLYFPLQEVNSEAPPEALPETHYEALPEAWAEALPEAWAEAQAEAHTETQLNRTGGINPMPSENPPDLLRE